MASDDIYNLLYPLLEDCMGLFKIEQTTTSKSYVQSLKSIHNNAVHIRPIAVDFIAKVAYKYDASPQIKANGYRSLLALLDSLLHIIVGHLQTIYKEKKYVFFRANQYNDKLRALAQNLHQMRALLGYAQIIIGVTENGHLFASERESDDIMHDCEIMAKSCFYSHVQGFQYYASIQPIIQALSMFTASYNDIAQQSSVWQSTKSLFNSGRYVVSPSVRGRQMEKIYSEADAHFFKAFFSLPEMGVGVLLPNLVGDAVRVNRVFSIPAKEFLLETTDGDKIEIKKAPFLDNEKHIKARLISAVLRDGQDSPDSPSLPDAGLDKSKVFLKAKRWSKSRSLLFFCHGGGFISLTTKSYEVMLREWSKALDCPIFSVDYSLAPDAPFPEALEECFYAYAWALRHAHFLGTTAEKIVFAGDSAGGNLVLSVAMRAATYGIKKPDSMIVMYPSCVVRLSASPSRLLAVMDPLLPHCMLSACLSAYTGFRTEKVAYNNQEHKLHPTKGVLEEEYSCSSTSPTQKCSDTLTSQSGNSSTENSIITTFLQDVGEGFVKLGPSSGSYETKSENEEFFTHEGECRPEPVSSEPSKITGLFKAVSSQPRKITGLFKGIGKKFNQVLSPSTSTSVQRSNTYWDSEFDTESLDVSDLDLNSGVELDDLGADGQCADLLTDGNSDLEKSTEHGRAISSTEAHFKIKLANNFAPLKSRYFGERTKVHNTALVKNPYISPGLAPDNMLSTLPYVDVVGCELDPLFDDSVTLSRRLHEIGHPHKFHVVHGLPHGFLSLQVCKDTRQASKMCLDLLKSHICEDGSAV